MNRRRDIDWMRGVAVLCMIEHHTFDAFLNPALHGGAADRLFRWVGGLAAPSFLFLAGLSMALLLEKQASRGVPLRAAGLAGAKRGLWILLGAYLFRVQEWALAFGSSKVSDMLRIDVLNCIGLALIAVALLWMLSRSALLFAALALIVSFATPLVWHASLLSLPRHLADYLHGTPPRALFPLFPWIAHAFAGAAAGLALARAQKREPYVMALFAVLAFAAWNLPQPAQWSDAAPAVFLLRDGLALGLLPLCWLVDRYLPRTQIAGPLTRLGRHSLIIYWVHVELVYGRWFWRTRGTLSLAQAALALGIVMAAMLALAYLLDGLKAPKRERSAPVLASATP